jgi:hypothetical protein
MSKFWITDEDKEEDITWKFTVKNGKVKFIGPADPVDTASITRTDEEGRPFFRIPQPDPEMVKAISQAVRDQFGDGVSGNGVYHEGDGELEFKPEKQS